MLRFYRNGYTYSINVKRLLKNVLTAAYLGFSFYAMTVILFSL